MSAPRVALFVAYGGGHISMVLPVMTQLKLLMPDLQCVLLAMTTGYAKAVAAGAKPLGYKDLLHLADAAKAEHWGRKLWAGNTSPDVSEVESIAYLGINYLDLIEQHGEAGAAAIYAKHGRYGFKPLHFMQRFFDVIAPDIVVTTNSPRSERAALEVAIQRGIPSLGMVDLFGQDDDTYIDQVSKPDWTCVISESIKQRLVSHGFPAGGVEVTGNPAFDGLFTSASRAQALAFMNRNGWEGLSPILWAGQVEPTLGAVTAGGNGLNFAIGVESILRDYVATRKQVALVVRYHPSQWHAFPRLQVQERVYFSVPSSEPVHPLILAAKAVVVQNSTVGLEAAVAGKSVVSLEHSPTVQTTFSLSAMGVSKPCYSTSELPAILDAVLSGGEATPGAFASDGHSAERVARTIRNALS